MGKAYSYDFRKKVMSYVKRGHACNAAGKKFDVAVNTVRNWKKRYESQGDYEEKKRPGKKPQVDEKAFEAYVKKNPGCLLKEIGAHFNMSGEGARYYMKKLGYVYKKKNPAMWKLKKS